MKSLYTISIAKLTLAALMSLTAAGIASAQQAETGPAAPAVTSVKVGVAMPKASFADGVDSAQASAGVRELIGSYLKGTRIEIIPLEGRLPQAQVGEAKEKGCEYILQTSVVQKRGRGGFGMFQAIAPALGSMIPMASRAGSVTGQVAGQVAQTVIVTAANLSSNTKPSDQFTLQYSLIELAGSSAKAADSLKAKARSEGEDVLSPLVEAMAGKVLAAVISIGR